MRRKETGGRRSTVCGSGITVCPNSVRPSYILPVTRSLPIGLKRMDLGDFETTVKVIVVGNGGVGKSSMTSRYCRGVFTSTYKKTIGVDFFGKDDRGG